jgi:hypothetical protein
MTTAITDVKLHRQIVEALLVEHETGTPPDDSERRRIFGCAWGLYAQIRGHARAALLLTEADMEHEAHVHVRAALEHALMLHWVVERGEPAVDAILASQEKQVQRSVRTAREAKLSLPAEVEAQISAEGAEGPIDVTQAYRSFKRVCEEVGGLSLYFVYGVESQFVHPSLLTINAYTDPSPGPGREILLTRPRPGDHHRHSFYLLAQCLIWSGRDLERLAPDPEVATGLEALAKQIEAATTLPPYSVVAK